MLLSLIALLGSGAVTAQPRPPLPNPEGCPAEEPDERASCVGLPDLTTCNYDYDTCPGSSSGVYTSFCECTFNTFFCGHAQPCVLPRSLYTAFPSSAPSAGEVIEQAAPPPPPQECPVELPADGGACAVSETCSYNPFNCPGRSGMFRDFCSCVNGAFKCGHAQPCAAVTTEFPSSAPSKAPVLEADTPWTYTKSSWMKYVKAAKPDERVRQCIEKQFPPQAGEPCSRRHKTCYWGEQDCPGFGAYPTTGCSCANGTWQTCEAEACPGA
jgi:hypothetical protein